MKLYTIRSANLGAEVKITTNWYDEATPAEIDEAADVAKERERLVERLNNLHANYVDLRLQRDKLLVAARLASAVFACPEDHSFADYTIAWKRTDDAIALCDAAEATNA